MLKISKTFKVMLSLVFLDTEIYSVNRVSKDYEILVIISCLKKKNTKLDFEASTSNDSNCMLTWNSFFLGGLWSIELSPAGGSAQGSLLSNQWLKEWSYGMGKLRLKL